MTVSVWVDDLVIAGSCTKQVADFKAKLRSAYKTDNLGELSWILGMRVTRDRTKRTLTLDQSLYIKDVMRRFDMDKPEKDPPLAIPADPNAKLSRTQCPTDPVDQARMKKLKYSSIVGSILFACVCTRPDIANATRDVCRYMHNPGMPHYRAAKRILRYLKGTPNLGITLGGSTNSIDRCAYSDS